MDKLTPIRIFVSSPGDVPAERQAIKEVARRLNDTLAKSQGFILDVLTWEDRVIPFAGKRPQEVVNEQIGPYDLFIGIMWSRFGTPTERFGSGTEEEFRLAYEWWTQKGKPKILFYFCSTPPRLTKEHIAQYGKVLEFKSELSAANLICEYEGSQSFEDLVRDHLTQHLANLFSAPVIQDSQAGVPATDKVLLPEPDRYAVFIASARDALEPRCDLLAEELRRREFEVHRPDDGLTVQDLISKARVCVHFLDGTSDAEVDDQLERSCSLAKRQILWLPKKVTLSGEETDPYRRRLHDLVSARKNLELMQGRDPVQDIVERLVELRTRENTDKETEKKGRCIFFNIQKKDRPNAATLFDYLQDRDVELFINRENSDEPTMREFDEKVSKARVFAVFYGSSVDRKWVERTLSSAAQLVIGKSFKVKKLAVYLAPPPREGVGVPIDLSLHKPLWIDHSEGFNPSKLEDLFAFLGPEASEVAV
ncbi:MAG TPA: DUF4062 domain-containing protein [Thermoanaerobaculia bacterium]|nr:DUF4062 domain-containing protein [Thermoanaerobaculia bacterium]